MLELSRTLRDRLAELAALDHPGEACGVLFGRRGPAGAWAVRLERLTNLARPRSLASYEVHPGELVSAERAARAAGLELLGFWHTHPDGTALPSARDRREAWPDATYLIAATARGRLRELRAWRLERGGAPCVDARMREEELV